MKQISVFLSVLLFACAIVQAQPTKGVTYTDSLTATGVTTSAKNTRGYDTYKWLRADIKPYKDKMLALKFTKTTDSVHIQGCWIDFGKDTVCVDLMVPLQNYKTLAGINTGAGVATARDTLLWWITPNYGAGKWNANAIVDLSNFHFPLYRIVSGLNDTGKTYIGDLRRGGY